MTIFLFVLGMTTVIDYFSSFSSFRLRHSLRGFLSIDIDVSELYINQCDNQLYSETRYSNFRNNKVPTNQDQQHQPPAAHFFAHQLIPLHPSTSYNEDHEIDAFHGSHKCHHESMDVSNLRFNWIFCC